MKTSVRVSIKIDVAKCLKAIGYIVLLLML
ncbi:hypothetical protein BW39_01685 [Delftia sp. RIT313]|nr:hypothetical protein BW39_01685 [Delftia sp. RIT313]